MTRPHLHRLHSISCARCGAQSDLAGSYDGPCTPMEGATMRTVDVTVACPVCDDPEAATAVAVLAKAPGARGEHVDEVRGLTVRCCCTDRPAFVKVDALREYFMDAAYRGALEIHARAA